jgi:hypothetical protein
MKIRRLITAAFLMLLFATTSLAGPPLVCHTFDIANATSLPWISHNWNLTGSEAYDTNNLPADTLAILDSDPTVLVHMETLRRAALYGAKDPAALKRLLLKLTARSDAAASNNAAIAQFDLGYFVEILTQVHWIAKDFANPAQNLDGYARIKKSLQLRPHDPQIEFAAALVTLEGPASEHQQYAQAALVGAKSDPLLDRNLSTHFIGPRSETMAELLCRNFTVKVARQ